MSKSKPFSTNTFRGKSLAQSFDRSLIGNISERGTLSYRVLHRNFNGSPQRDKVKHYFYSRKWYKGSKWFMLVIFVVETILRNFPVAVFSRLLHFNKFSIVLMCIVCMFCPWLKLDMNLVANNSLSFVSLCTNPVWDTDC